MYMNDGFNCCGLGEYCSFPERETWTDKQLADIKTNVSKHLGPGCAYSHIVVTIKDKWQNPIGKVLKELKFKYVGKAVNPNTDNLLHMYVYMRPTEKKLKRKPKLTFK